MTNNDSVSCGTVVNAETGKTCGIEGDIREMFYFLLPNKQIIVPCPTCKKQLAAGFKADGKPFRYATVASVLALAEFNIELVTGLEIHAGHCSFRACDCKLEAGEEMVLRDGEEYRRLCGNCSAALDIISIKAQEELKMHASGEKKLGKRDLQTVTRQAKLVPETMRAALKAIAALKEQARTRTEAAKQLARAQLGTAPSAKPTSVATPAQPVPAPKADHVLPADFGKKYRALVEVYGLDKGLFTEALQRAHATKTSILDEVRKTKDGVAAIERRNAEFEAKQAAEQSAPVLPADVVAKRDPEAIPDAFAGAHLYLLDDYGLDGAVFQQARIATYFSTPRVNFLDELDKIPEGHEALERMKAGNKVKPAHVTTSKPAHAGNSGPLTQNPFAGLADAAAQTAQA